MGINWRQVLLILPICACAQKQPLKGVVVSHPVTPDSVLVVNRSKSSYSFTDQNGRFSIAASVSDTLVISAKDYREQKVIVQAAHFNEPVVISLVSVANALDEVVVNRYQLTGDLAKDSRNIVVAEEFKIDVDFANLPEQNIDNTRGDINFSVMPTMESSLSGVNFVMLGGMVANLLGVKSESKAIKPKLDFAVTVQDRFSDEFLIRIAKIKPDQLALFLNFCEANQPQDIELLEPANELALVDFLLAKADEFRKL